MFYKTDRTPKRKPAAGCGCERETADMGGRKGLPLGTKVSCGAGALAEEAHSLHSASLKPLRALRSATQVHIGNKPINSKLKRATRKLAQAPGMLELACRKSKRSGASSRMAGWEARKQAVPAS